MKKMIKLAMAVALTAFAVACSNQEDIPATNENEVNGSTGPTEFSIEGIINGYEETADSRAEAQTVVRIHWENGETVYVYEGTNCIGYLTAQADANNKAIAKLRGTLIPAPSGTKPLTLVYSPQFTTGAPTVTDGKITLDLSKQNTADVPFLVYGVISNLKQNVSNKAVNFQLATSVYKCNVADLSKISTIDEASVDNINTKCVLTLSDSGANPIVGGESLGTITRTAGINANVNDERAIFAFALPVSGEADARTITVKRNGKKQTANFTKTAIAPAKSFNSVYAFEEAGSGSGSDEFVEIGGLRWATKNLGATTIADSYETCAGDFYQWGSLETLYSAKTLNEYNKWSFTWKSGITYGFDVDHLENKWQTYPGGPLPNSKDVVMQKMDGWRMPTEAEFKALVLACVNSVTTSGADFFADPTAISSATPTGGIYYLPSTQTYLSEYAGVAGVLFVDKTTPTKRVFFPFVAPKLNGKAPSASTSAVGSEGVIYYYTTKDYYQTLTYRAFAVASYTINSTFQYFYYGAPIRPVQEIN